MPDATLEALCRRIEDWEQRVRDRPVTPRLPDEALRARLARYDFVRPRPLEEMVPDIADLLERATIHTTHPRYFGLFNPGVKRAGVIADTLVAVYNPQLGARWHSPAAGDIEQMTLDYFRRRIGYPAGATSASFTTGGSEANLVGVLAGLSRAFPRHADEGLAGLRPVFYASDQAHDSFVKIAHITGLGRQAFRRVKTDARGRLDIADLRRAVARDRAEGRSPFLVVATVGTTATGAIDPMSELAEVCRAEDLWLHADAAWGGIALLSDALRAHVVGVELADSITWDAHKSLPVPMGAGMFFSRRPANAEAAFAVTPGYIPDHGEVANYQRTIQWSRRSIGMKVFFTLAELGQAGISAMIDHQAAMGRLLGEELRGAGWRVTNDSPLPLVCFTRDGIDADAVARAVSAEGAAWISDVRLADGNHWLRACITHHATSPEDIRLLVAAVDRAAG
jgi:aromatic-L-amino-acid/L-tryptophan decarboxylase